MAEVVPKTNSAEFPPRPIFTPPAVESLFHLDSKQSPWPEDIRNNEQLADDIEERQTLAEQLDTFFRRVPKANTEVADALAFGHAQEGETIKLYESLSRLLEHDDAKRIVLYLPFELIPNRNRDAGDEPLNKAQEHFTEHYLKRWKELLKVRDVRANFVDGDVLEVDQRVGDLPRVVKAAHLVPKLVERGLLTTQEVIDLANDSSDETLRNSVADALPVLSDLGLLSHQDLEYMHETEDPMLRGLTVLIRSANARPPKSKIESVSTVTPDAFHGELAQAEQREYEDMTEARAAWLRQEERRIIIEKYAERLAAGIVAGIVTEEAAKNFATSTEGKLAFIRGMRSVVETTAKDDSKKAKILMEQYGTSLSEILTDDESSEVHDALVHAFSRLNASGAISKDDLQQIGISIPALAGPFSTNLERREGEIKDLAAAARSVEQSPELSKLIYPTALFFGSQLKGYGGKAADIDVAVFVKPGTSFAEREKMQTLLQQHFAHEKLHGKIVEFWLTDEGDNLAIQDFPSPDSSLGDKTWAHVLFGAAWSGKSDAIKELHKKLLAPYLYGEVGSPEDRGVWLEEMERDTLQYRLMHKGYDRFFPEQGGMDTPHADSIDGDSTFWDSGYRRTATNLFVNQVFLPRVQKKRS